VREKDVLKGRKRLSAGILQSEQHSFTKAPSEESFILASASPRRKELLKKLVKRFQVIVSHVDEHDFPKQDPVAYALMVAEKKAQTVCQEDNPKRSHAWILAADTIVVLEDRILGKPRDRDQARQMLTDLQGKQHRVITGICLMHVLKGICCVEAVQTHVWMRRIGDREIDDYIRTGEPFDKAGGYAIQGLAGQFVKKVQGSYTNVVGLPLERLQELFETYGI